MSSHVANVKGDTNEDDLERGEIKTDYSRLLVNLPTELLIKILSSYLPTRDKFNLQYVSRRLQDVSKVSLLWNEFVWPDYEPHHVTEVCEVLKAYSERMRRILFPGHVTPAKTLEMAHCCTKVKRLSLPKNTQLLE